MDAGLDQVLHLHNCHALPSCLLAGSRLLKKRLQAMIFFSSPP